MDLISLLSTAQGGNAMNNMANQMNLQPDQAQSVVSQLLPALTAGMQRNTQSPEGMSGLMNALSGTRHEAYVDTPDAVFQPAARDEGNAILGHLLGSKDVSRGVAQQASENTGVDAGTIRSMLPMVANMLMGTMSKQTSALTQRQSGIGGMLGSLLGGGAQRQQSNLLSQMMGGGGSGGMDILNMATRLLK